MRVYVACVGCEQRELDAQLVSDYVRACGEDVVESPDRCDTAVLVTCGVDAANENRSFEALRNLAERIPSSSRMVVGGCIPSINPARLSTFKVDATFSPRTLSSLKSILGLSLDVDQVRYPNISIFDRSNDISVANSPREEYEMAKNGFKIRIDSGCLLQCSYCAIRHATGRLESVDADAIITQTRGGVARGVQSIMLVGGDTGAYGLDRGTSLDQLLRRILAVQGSYRLFIHDFNVNWFLRRINDFLSVFATQEAQRVRAISFPVQSGSDKILKQMRRPYSADSSIAGLRRMREIAPHIRQGTHIMVGFPGETEQDFVATVDMLDRARFDFVTCFAYSPRPNTYASALKIQVSPEVVAERLQRLASQFRDVVQIVA